MDKVRFGEMDNVVIVLTVYFYFVEMGYRKSFISLSLSINNNLTGVSIL